MQEGRREGRERREEGWKERDGQGRKETKAVKGWEDGRNVRKERRGNWIGATDLSFPPALNIVSS
jgi:hypothetical protein